MEKRKKRIACQIGSSNMISQLDMLKQQEFRIPQCISSSVEDFTSGGGTTRNIVSGKEQAYPIYMQGLTLGTSLRKRKHNTELVSGLESIYKDKTLILFSSDRKSDFKNYLYLPSDRKSKRTQGREYKIWTRNQELTNLLCCVKDKYVKWEMELDIKFGVENSITMTDYITKWMGFRRMEQIPPQTNDFFYSEARRGFKLWLDYMLLEPLDKELFFLVGNQKDMIRGA